MNVRKLYKYSSIYRQCALHISDKIIQEGNELADIVVQKFRALPEGVIDSFMFKDLEVFITKGPFQANCDKGKMVLTFKKDTDDRFIRSTVVHEYTHHVQHDQDMSYVNLYHTVSDTASLDDDNTLLEDAVSLSDYLKSNVFKNEPSFQSLVDQMSESSRSGNVDETRRLLNDIFYLLHNNSPREVEAIRHETYQSFKSHLESADKVTNNINRFKINTIREYFHLLIKYAESLILQKLFPSNQKKVLKAMWGLIQEYKPFLYELGLKD